VKPQTHLILFVLVCTTASLSCHESSRDDHFARSFINRVYQRDTAVFSQLEPGSLLSEFAAKRLASVADRLPPPPPDSVRLVGRETLYGMDAAPSVSRKLSYLIDAASRETRVDLWLVTKNRRTYVYEVQATQTAAAH
jgi:hypothetical protein